MKIPCIPFKEIEKANWYDSMSETYRFIDVDFFF